MVTFSVPLQGDISKRFFTFKVETDSVMFAGSRYGHIDPETCRLLISQFGKLGFAFITGCANGIDRCFRDSLSISDYKDKTVIACAFKERADRIKDVCSLFVVPDNLPPKAALAKRTLWMTNNCSLLILFPSDPIGRGSSLAFKSAIHNNKPVFVVSKIRPSDSPLYSVFPSSLFGVVVGYWCVPPIYADTKLCYETL